jgi:hypothetical protein
MSDERRLHELLGALRRGDERGVVMSSEALVADLGWSPVDVADTVREAKAMMLIWGFGGGGQPQPRFDEIELTVQGNRYLRDAAANG